MGDAKDSTWIVFGLARSGCAAGALLRRQGARVVGVDDAPEAGFAERWAAGGLTELAAAAFDECLGGPDWPGRAPAGVDGIVLSPGVPLDHPALRPYAAAGVEIIGELELGWRHCRGVCVAITGTNGKTTTTELAAHLLRAAGCRAEALGNVGRPLSLHADAMSPDDVAVLEISSFQCETLRRFRPAVAAVLNLAPDHLDRYPDIAAYHAAKRRLVESLGPDGVFVTWTGCAEARRWPAPRTLLFGEEAGAAVRIADGSLRLERDGDVETLLALDELAIAGAPNARNAAAAAAMLLPLGVDSEALRVGLRSFRGLPHRQETVAAAGGVVFVNDSKATNVHAVCAGLESYAADVVLIVGGSGKGEDYAPLRAALGPVKAVVGLGAEASAIVAALGGDRPAEFADTMADAVARAARLAAGRGTVLLSPACASFDMFRDYNARGEAFREAAAATAAAAKEDA